MIRGKSFPVILKQVRPALLRLQTPTQESDAKQKHATMNKFGENLHLWHCRQLPKFKHLGFTATLINIRTVFALKSTTLDEIAVCLKEECNISAGCL